MAAPLDLSGQLIHFDNSVDADPIASYLKKMAPVCPFIDPSERAGCLYASQVALDCQTSQEIHPRMFEQLVPAIERFREQRRGLTDKSDRLLLSHTIVFGIPAHLHAETNRQMGWPNWLGFLIKELYTSKAIVFGFIRRGIAERSSEGEAMPVCPFHAVVIRSKIVGADHRFFAGNQALLSALAEASDDGGDVHAGLLPDMPDIRDPLSLRSGNYFQRLKAWGQSRFRV